MNATTAKALRVAVAAMMLLALGLSFSHIAELAALGGAGWERWIAPVLVDFVAVLGKIGSGAQFNARTRRTGRRTLWVTGTVSLAANAGIGFVHRSPSGVAIGVSVVVVALWAESFLHGMGVKPSARKVPAAPAAVNKDGKTAEQVRRSEIARKAAATRKANAQRAADEAAVLAAAELAARLPEDTRGFI